MVKVVLEQPLLPLGSLEPFDGFWNLRDYYTGDFPPYQPIATENRINSGDDRYTSARQLEKADAREAS